jgi:hypothetical protein
MSRGSRLVELLLSRKDTFPLATDFSFRLWSLSLPWISNSKFCLTLIYFRFPFSFLTSHSPPSFLLVYIPHSYQQHYHPPSFSQYTTSTSIPPHLPNLSYHFTSSTLSTMAAIKPNSASPDSTDIFTPKEAQLLGYILLNNKNKLDVLSSLSLCPL